MFILFLMLTLSTWGASAISVTEEIAHIHIADNEYICSHNPTHSNPFLSLFMINIEQSAENSREYSYDNKSHLLPDRKSVV